MFSAFILKFLASFGSSLHPFWSKFVIDLASILSEGFGQGKNKFSSNALFAIAVVGVLDSVSIRDPLNGQVQRKPAEVHNLDKLFDRHLNRYNASARS